MKPLRLQWLHPGALGLLGTPVVCANHPTHALGWVFECADRSWHWCADADDSVEPYGNERTEAEARAEAEHYIRIQCAELCRKRDGGRP